jgi:hypothetical protein
MFFEVDLKFDSARFQHDLVFLTLELNRRTHERMQIRRELVLVYLQVKQSHGNGTGPEAWSVCIGYIELLPNALHVAQQLVLMRFLAEYPNDNFFR